MCLYITQKILHLIFFIDKKVFYFTMFNLYSQNRLKQIVVEDTAKLLTNDITVELKKEETIESIKQNGDN